MRIELPDWTALAVIYPDKMRGKGYALFMQCALHMQLQKEQGWIYYQCESMDHVKELLQYIHGDTCDMCKETIRLAGKAPFKEVSSRTGEFVGIKETKPDQSKPGFKREK